jgi:hypothetical protein
VKEEADSDFVTYYKNDERMGSEIKKVKAIDPDYEPERSTADTLATDLLDIYD